MTFKDLLDDLDWANIDLHRFGLEEIEKFSKKRHPENPDLVLIGWKLAEKEEPEYLVYLNEKTKELFTEPEYYIKLIMAE